MNFVSALFTVELETVSRWEMILSYSASRSSHPVDLIFASSNSIDQTLVCFYALLDLSASSGSSNSQPFMGFYLLMEWICERVDGLTLFLAYCTFSSFFRINLT